MTRLQRLACQPWLWVCAIPGLASALVWLAGQTSVNDSLWVQTLAWDANLWPHRPWTLWTAPLVHLSGMHLLANLLALAALAVMGLALQANSAAAIAVLLAWPLSTLSLLAWADVAHVAGLSGLNHAVALVFIVFLAIHSIANSLLITTSALVGIKLLSEHAWSQPVQASTAWGFDVVVAAHLGGAAAGAACGMLTCGLQRLRTSRRESS